MALSDHGQYSGVVDIARLQSKSITSAEILY